MKRVSKCLIAMLTMILLIGLCPTSAFAKEYTYQITLYAGNHGKLNEQAINVEVLRGGSPEISLDKDGSKVVISKLMAGDRVSFNYQDGVTVKEDSGKYYVQGIRRSGRDNDTSNTEKLSFSVEEDADYVVAYGIQGDMIGYTIDYVVRGTEEQLIPSRTYYAKSGDKVVVSAPNIDGYVPNAYAQTMTISPDRNHFVFEYREGEVEIVQLPGETITTVVTQPGGGTGTGTGATGAGTGAAGAGAGTAGEGTGAAGEDAEAAEGTTVGDTDDETTTVEDEEVPQDLVDLDDEEAPKANIKLDKEEVKKGFPMAAGIAVSVAAVAALVGMIIFLKRHRH